MANKLAARIAGTTGTKCCCKPPVEMQCKYRGGAATKGGYPSFDGSEPKRRWLRVDMAYTVTYDCGSGQKTTTRSAYGVYNPENFSAGPSGENMVLINGWSASDQYFCSAHSPYVKAVTTSTSTAIPGAYISIGSCCGSDYPYTLVSGSEVCALSEEDSDEDAEARITSAWSEWAGYTETACDAGACCIAYRTDYYISTEVQWYVKSAMYRIGLYASGDVNIYPIAVDIIRRKIGETEWVLVATDILSVTPSTDRDAWVAHDVPQLRGYETTVTNPRHYDSETE